MKLKENGNYIVSLRCKDSLYHITGSEKRPCVLCGELSWVSPVLKNKKVDGVICIHCAKNQDLSNSKIDMKTQLKVLEQLKNRKDIIAG